MGSFSSTCALSGLGIESGEAVRFYFLTANPYSEMACYTHSRWFPRSLPFRARYNDYGGIHEVHPDDLPLVLATEANFNLDICTQGWGDNAAHDTPTQKGMTLQHLMEAARGRRLKVGRYSVMDEYFKTHRDFMRETPMKFPKGVPSFKRIHKILDPLAARWDGYQTGKDGYLVRRYGYGTYRVRWHGNKEVQMLEKFETCFGDLYATMISHGQGSYASRAELWVTAKPNADINSIGYKKRQDPPLPVAYAMIREDVWQALVDNPPALGWGKTPTGLDTYIKDLGDLHSGILATRKDHGALSDLMIMDRKATTEIYHQDIVPFRLGLATAFKTVWDHVPSGMEDHVLQSAAGLSIIWQWHQIARKLFQPSNTVGPQFPDRPEEADFLRRMLSISTRLEAEQIEREKNWEIAELARKEGDTERDSSP